MVERDGATGASQEGVVSNSDEDRPALKPCPFCGAQAEAKDLAGWEIFCSDPDCSVNLWALDNGTYENVAAQWNRRTPPAAEFGADEARNRLDPFIRLAPVSVTPAPGSVERPPLEEYLGYAKTKAIDYSDSWWIAGVIRYALHLEARLREYEERERPLPRTPREYEERERRGKDGEP
jgi:hypothetical protein